MMMSAIHTLRKLLAGAHLDEKPGEGSRSPHWPAMRRQWLEAHPTCAACGGRDHLEVHHQKPFHLHPELELEPSNLITLCERPGRECHYLWGHNGESWSEFNPEVVADTAAELKRLEKRRAECARETPAKPKSKRGLP